MHGWRGWGGVYTCVCWHWLILVGIECWMWHATVYVHVCVRVRMPASLPACMRSYECMHVRPPCTCVCTCQYLCICMHACVCVCTCCDGSGWMGGVGSALLCAIWVSVDMDCPTLPQGTQGCGYGDDMRVDGLLCDECCCCVCNGWQQGNGVDVCVRVFMSILTGNIMTTHPCVPALLCRCWPLHFAC